MSHSTALATCRCPTGKSQPVTFSLRILHRQGRALSAFLGKRKLRQPHYQRDEQNGRRALGDVLPHQRPMSLAFLPTRTSLHMCRSEHLIQFRTPPGLQFPFG